MVQLIEKQKFDGSWTLDEGLCGILNTGLQKIKDAAVVKVCRIDIKSNLFIWSFGCTLKIISYCFIQIRNQTVYDHVFGFYSYMVAFLHALYYVLLILYYKTNPVFFKDLNVWTTAIIIAVFRKEFDQHKSEWKMIEEKALKWLKTKDLEGKDVVQEAMTFLTT